MQQIQKHDLGAANRLSEVRKKILKMKQVKLAEILGFPQTNLSAMENGSRRISMNILLQLEKDYGINPQYIINGKTPKVIGEKEKSTTLSNTMQMNDKIDRLIKEVMVLTRNLDAAWKLIENQERRISELESKKR